ncbi:N-acetyltransferase [Oceanobacillus alkalisoli]|uniref:N-acetyltransferase n=1 Tax=Oceanobacillus alkalisoli TaxID=2925113 RepID=UPI001EEFDBFC|nr:N-acetyltransferase [Oceanobacillus alkalisoli]MCF3942529.1 N-acetyltransferase [Oceanobacillus alkalisoli]MCG5103586.1 N-acetyltransferase [Oceanobacillus alkalisoli]
MNKVKVENLLINYKTLEKFKRFKEYGNQELSMLEDLQNNFIENNSESPFYGIYIGENLIARMSLYRIKEKYDNYFDPPQDYLALWKLEVLPDYQGHGYGKLMVDYAKSFNLPIKTSPRINSQGFWEKMSFQKAQYDLERDLGENPLIWLPQGVQEKEAQHSQETE